MASIISKFKNRLNMPPQKTTLNLLKRNSQTLANYFQSLLHSKSPKSNHFTLSNNNIVHLGENGRRRFVFSIDKLLTSVSFPRCSIFNYLNCVHGRVKPFSLLEKNAIRKIVRGSHLPIYSIPCVKIRNLCT